jgi:hypothetical protein
MVSMANDNLAYMVIAFSVLLVAGLVKYTRQDMQRGLRVIRGWLPF